MRSVLVILFVSAGTVAALLLPTSRRLARSLWPGPTVKGPGDVYVQAFQAIVCVVGLSVIAALSSLVAFVLASASDWPAGQWLSALPLVCLIFWAGVLCALHRR